MHTNDSLTALSEIKSRIRLADIVGRRVALKRSGSNFKGLCPFHDDGTHPSFYVFSDTDKFYCFGCHARGDVIDFIAEMDGLSWIEAMQQAATLAGVALPEREVDHESERLQEARKRLLFINEVAQKYFTNVLHLTNAGTPGRNYLKHRSVATETAEQFGIGYAPDVIDGLIMYFRKHRPDVAESELMEAGLIREKDGRKYDFFRGRVMFPIRNTKGEIVGFGGRTVLQGKPKYLNTQATILFDKGRNLFGIDLAKDAIRVADVAVVVEGYLDVVSLHQAGVKNVVAPLGTALTEGQVELLKKFARKKIILSLDKDRRGQEATAKAVRVIEQSADIEIRVLEIPNGKDPDEFIKNGGDAAYFQEIVEAALPVIEFHLQLVAVKYDLTSAHGKSDACAEMAQELAGIKDQVVQDHYVKYLSNLTDTPVETVRSLVWHYNRQVEIATRYPDYEDALAKLTAAERLEDAAIATAIRYYPTSMSATSSDGEAMKNSDLDNDDNSILFGHMSACAQAGKSIDDVVVAIQDDPTLMVHFDRMYRTGQRLPDIEDEQDVLMAMRFRLDKLRKYALNKVYQQLKKTLSELEPDSDDAEAIFEGAAGISRVMRQYPK